MSEGRSTGLRASDADRERVVALLRKHYTAGRITLEEFGERAECAYLSRSRVELRELVRDLPEERSWRYRVRLSGPVVTYLSVMCLLIVIWAVSGAGYFWPIWPMLGWGMGIVGKPAGGRSDREVRRRSERHGA